MRDVYKDPIIRDTIGSYCQYFGVHVGTIVIVSGQENLQVRNAVFER